MNQNVSFGNIASIFALEAFAQDCFQKFCTSLCCVVFMANNGKEGVS